MLFGLALMLTQGRDPIVRDGWGVPHIRASSQAQAWYLTGYATAQDRLWQMETSRRVAEGRMSEAFGPAYVASDTETLKLGYTQEELTQQYRSLKETSREAIDAYAKGVNAWIIEGGRTNHLPVEYAANHLQPQRWTTTDSVAVAVSLLQRFGKGASGQLRNLAGLEYFRSQKQLAGRDLDVFDDFLWQNDSASPTTVEAVDDHPEHPFPTFTRADTLKQLNALPHLGLLELLPALQLVERDEATAVAQRVGAPYKVGSYAIVVSPARSATGHALLLSGPQMGFSNPSVVHEIAVSAPGLDVTGMDLPGVPGVLVGCTKSFAWGLTSGVADTDDVYVYSRSYGLSTEKLLQSLPVRGEASRQVEQLRVDGSPVILATKTHLLTRKSAYWMHEMRSYETLLDLYPATRTSEVEGAIRRASMSFNFFYATVGGDTGYLYVGDVPIRPRGIDPRLPIPAGRDRKWSGFVPKEEMPHARNPQAGLLTNWNNKPAQWWPNLDTPVWGEINHVSEIRSALNKPRLSPEDLRLATQTIATREETWPLFSLYLARIPPSDFSGRLQGFHGDAAFDPGGAAAYRDWFFALRHELFAPSVGTMLSEELFRTAVQPSLVLHALQGKTSFDYLAGRSADEVVAAAAKAGEAHPAGSKPDEIAVPSAAPIPYRNRGTFIQIVDLASPPVVQTVLPPGETAAGPHREDQAALARQWALKPMLWRF